MLLDRDKSLIDNSRACICLRCTLFFFVRFPKYYSGIPYQLRTIHALFTHNRRTIHGQYTDNKRTIPYTSSEDEDTISAFTPYTLHPTLSRILRLPSLFTSLTFPYSTERTPTDDREDSERRPYEKKALFLRLSPKKVDLIPEKVDSLPKKVDCFPKFCA